MHDPIPPAPEGWPTAEPAALERSRTDGGRRARVARALWTRDDQPGPEARVGGFVYDLADQVAAALDADEEPQ